MGKRTKRRVYWRLQGGACRAYGDFRDFTDVGGKREPLVVPGESRATTDKALAETLAAQRLTTLQRKRAESQGRAVVGLPPVTTLAAYVREHLLFKESELDEHTGEPLTDQWLEGEEMRLQRAIDHFGADRDLTSIKTEHVQAFDQHLVSMGLGGGSRRQHLNSLSNLYRRASATGKVEPGYNPVRDLPKKPKHRTLPAHWLEVPEAALLLESARTFEPKRDDIAMPFAYQLIATALLTGGRPAEVLGLELMDVSLERNRVTFRPNEWRRLKTLTSHRSVTLWPQLAEILKPWIAQRKLAGGRLLFPSYRTGQEAMLTDVRKLLDAVSARVGYKPREVNLYDFRHTYCAARLQTLDGDAPVSPYTVGQELGHGGDSLVKRVYGHLGTVRHRSKAVEYRVQQHLKAQHRERPVRDWVKALRAA